MSSVAKPECLQRNSNIGYKNMFTKHRAPGLIDYIQTYWPWPVSNDALWLTSVAKTEFLKWQTISNFKKGFSKGILEITKPQGALEKSRNSDILKIITQVR